MSSIREGLASGLVAFNVNKAQHEVCGEDGANSDLDLPYQGSQR